MPLVVFEECLVRPVEQERDGKARVFVPRSGAVDRQTRIDTPLKRKGEVSVHFYTFAKRTSILSFHAAHYLTTNFTFRDKDTLEEFTAWVTSGIKESRTGYSSGVLVFSIEEV